MLQLDGPVKIRTSDGAAFSAAPAGTSLTWAAVAVQHQLTSKLVAYCGGGQEITGLLVFLLAASPSPSFSVHLRQHSHS